MTPDWYKCHLYYPVVDSFLTEMGKQFSQFRFYKGCSKLLPTLFTFLDFSTLSPIIQEYELDADSLKMETILAKRSL